MFQQVAAGDESRWDFVERGLLSVLGKTRESWNTEDVRRLLRGGRVQLFIREEGFVILARREDEWSLEPYLLVWVAWFKPQTALAIQEQLFDWLDTQKRESGCRSIRILSPRRGWEKRLAGKFRIRSITWERR